MNKKNLMIVSLVLLTLFLTYTYFVAREYLIQFDFDTMVRIQDAMPVQLDPYLSWLSWLGSFELTTALTLIITAFVSWKKWRRSAIFIMFTVFHLIELLFKTIIDQVAPPYMFLRTTNEFHFPSSYISTDYFAYPSGHVGRGAFLGTLAIMLLWKSTLDRRIKCAGYGLVLIVFTIMFVSRVSLGEHWLSDAIGGTLLGISLALLGVVFW